MGGLAIMLPHPDDSEEEMGGHGHEDDDEEDGEGKGLEAAAKVMFEALKGDDEKKFAEALKKYCDMHKAPAEEEEEPKDGEEEMD